MAPNVIIKSVSASVSQTVKRDGGLRLMCELVQRSALAFESET